ncbi:MAG: hypothetical protein ACKV2V_07025 [Blastocatellia bacterium]
MAPRHCVAFSLFCLSALLLSAISALSQQKAPAGSTTRRPGAGAMTNRDVMRLAQAKVGDDIIIARIRQSQTQFDLSTDALIRLKTAGVSEAVLKVMMESAGATPAPAIPPASANTAAAPAPARPAAEPAHAALEKVALGARFAVRARPTPTPPRAAIRSAPQSYGLYIETGGQLKPVGRIQTKVQHSKWRSLVASRVPFVRQKIDINIPGAHADSRFETQWPAFYAFFPPGRDVSKFKLIHCKITGQGFDQRTVANLSIMFSREQNQDEIVCDIGPADHKDLYRIIPREELTSGEYAFVEGNPGSQSAENVQIIDVWDFGIDRKEDKLGITEYLDGFSLISKGDPGFFNWSKDEAQKIVDAHAAQEDTRGKMMGPFKRQFASLGVYWMDEQFARAFARLEMLDRNLTPDQAGKLAALLTSIDPNHNYMLVTVGQKIGSGRLIGANEAERTMRPYDALLYNARDNDYIVPAKKIEGLGGYAGVWRLTFDQAGIKGALTAAGPEVWFEARLNQNLDVKSKFRAEQLLAGK